MSDFVETIVNILALVFCLAQTTLIFIGTFWVSQNLKKGRKIRNPILIILALELLSAGLLYVLANFSPQAGYEGLPNILALLLVCMSSPIWILAMGLVWYFHAMNNSEKRYFYLPPIIVTSIAEFIVLGIGYWIWRTR